MTAPSEKAAVAPRFLTHPCIRGESVPGGNFPSKHSSGPAAPHRSIPGSARHHLHLLRLLWIQGRNGSAENQLEGSIPVTFVQQRETGQSLEGLPGAEMSRKQPRNGQGVRAVAQTLNLPRLGTAKDLLVLRDFPAGPQLSLERERGQGAPFGPSVALHALCLCS